MKKETIGEVVGHPLWVLPVFMLSFFIFIEALHTSAHLHGEIDVHGICRNNKEYIEMKEQEENDW
tara:strand:+ start:252 stop:446 length:195 start_codon:yes stop_codon:yes gene_type:complete